MNFKKILALLTAILTAVVCSICAVADDLGEGGYISIVGAKPITADEARRALSIALDLEVSQLNGMYVFVEDTANNVVNVHTAVPSELTIVETIFYASNGDICGASGWAVTPDLMLKYFVDIIVSGVDGIMDLGNLGFSFMMGNAFLAFIICIGFGFTAFMLFRKAFKTSKKI